MACSTGIHIDTCRLTFNGSLTKAIWFIHVRPASTRLNFCVEGYRLLCLNSTYKTYTGKGWKCSNRLPQLDLSPFYWREEIFTLRSGSCSCLWRKPEPGQTSSQVPIVTDQDQIPHRERWSFDGSQMATTNDPWLSQQLRAKGAK